MAKKSKHPANYYNDLFSGTPEEILDVLKKYPIQPPDDVETYKGMKLRDIENARPDGSIAVSQISPTRKVAWLNFSKTAKGNIAYSMQERTAARTLVATSSYTPNTAHVACYWLPWNSEGGIISIKIPTAGSRGRDEPDPDLFFTAAINGCSVFVSGTPDSPTVYHCGGSTSQTTMAGGAKFWRDLMTRLVGGGGIQAEVNKTDYIKTDGIRDTGGGLTTQAAKDYAAWLKSNTSDMLNITDVSPFGCVMGIRSGGNWKFYLQENATVKYTVLKKKYGLFGPKVAQKENALGKGQDGIIKKLADPNTGKKVVIDKIRYICYPIRVREIYPRAVGGGCRIFQPLPKVEHG